MFGRGLRCFDFANHMPFSIILLVGCCFTCDVSLLSLSFSVFLCLSLSFSVFLCFSLSFSVLLCLSLSLFFSLFFSLSLSLSLSLSCGLSLSLPFSVLLCPSVSLCLSVPMQALLQEELEALETQRSSLRKVGGCWF